MKYLKTFKTHEQYNHFNYFTDHYPFISYCHEHSDVYFHDENYEHTVNIQNNEILYTTNNNSKIVLGNAGNFDSTIVSHTYNDGIGIIKFNSDVTVIGDYTFSRCESLTEIILPNSILSIGADAFNNCINLTEINIPINVTTIGAGAFWQCTGLRKITLNKNISQIGEMAFVNCTGELIIDSNTIVSYNYPSLDKRPTIDKTSWLYGAKFNKITFGTNILSIGKLVFNGLTSLTTVDFSKAKNLTVIGTASFENTKLEFVNISDYITTIQSYAFKNTPIKTLYIGKNVKTIELCAFELCTSLTNINYSETTVLQTIGDSAFLDCHALRNIIIPDTVTTIGGLVFRGCYSAENIVFGNGITEIPWSSFSVLGWQQGADVKTHISIGSNVKNISGYAFEGRRIDSLTIPANVKKIANIALASTTISNLWFEGQTEIENGLLGTITNIYVQDYLENFYKTHSSFTGYINKIKPYSSLPSEQMMLRVMSFNMSVDRSSGNYWPARKDAYYSMIEEYAPAIIGLQESMFKTTWEELRNRFATSGYDGYSVIRMNNEDYEEGTSILYDKTKFHLIFRTNFWLSKPSTAPYPTISEEREKEPDRTWFGAQYRRVANLAIFRCKQTRRIICFINTHFDLRTSAHEGEMNVIMEKFKEYGNRCDTWILTGDFNTTIDSEVMQNIILHKGFINKPVSDPTFNGYGTESSKIIDHILFKENSYNNVNTVLITRNSAVITKPYNGIPYISDHYPIYTEFGFAPIEY